MLSALTLSTQRERELYNMVENRITRTCHTHIWHTAYSCKTEDDPQYEQEHGGHVECRSRRSIGGDTTFTIWPKHHRMRPRDEEPRGLETNRIRKQDTQRAISKQRNTNATGQQQKDDSIQRPSTRHDKASEHANARTQSSKGITAGRRRTKENINGDRLLD